MNRTISKTRSIGQLISTFSVAALLATSAITVSAQSQNSASPNSHVGVWAAQVTLRDCTTGAPIGPAFRSVVTFHQGGTYSEGTASPNFAIGQRTPGQGTWTQTGPHTYDIKFISLIVFDTPANLPGTPGFNPALPISPGFFAGWQIVTQTSETDADGNATSRGSFNFYKATGEVYRTGCSTSISQRL